MQLRAYISTAVACLNNLFPFFYFYISHLGPFFVAPFATSETFARSIGDILVELCYFSYCAFNGNFVVGSMFLDFEAF